MNLLRCKPASHIFIAIPSYHSTLTSDTCFALVDALPKLAMAGITVDMKCVEGICYVDLARNELVKHFLDSKATDLIFIDADVAFKTETIARLCSSNRPLTAAIYPKKDDEEKFPVELIPGKAVDAEGLLEVGWAPTGMMRINRVVFEALKPTVAEYRGRGGLQQHAYFKCDIRNGAYWGEDIEFCRIWREAGGKIWVYPDETLSHTGPKSWINNLGEAMRRGPIKQ